MGGLAQIGAFGGASSGPPPVNTITRPKRTVFVGEALDGTVVPTGSEIAPFPDFQAASDWAVGAGVTDLRIIASPETYPDWTIPAGIRFYVECGVTGASLPNLTVVATGGGVGPIVLDGVHVTTALVVQTTGVDDQAVIVFKSSADCPTATKTGPGQAIIAATGAIAPATFFVAITFSGPVDIGDGYFVVDNADVQQSVTCGLYSSFACRNPSAIFISGTQAKFSLAELSGGFYASPVITFTGAPGVVQFDAQSLVSFALAGGQIVNGTLSTPGFFASYPICSSAKAAGVPVRFDSDTTVGTIGTTYADMLALAGFTITAAAMGDRALVVGEGGSITGSFTGLVAGEAQYVCDGAIVPESGLAAYIAGAAAGSWYRRIGTARNATTIVPGFGEPQQVPVP